jgi:exopolysaccharide biosynthesis predicted pyruvyltransferase EpsI
MLLGIPHVLLENNYGKLGDFVDSHTSGSALMRRVPDVRAAVELVRTMP